MANFLSVYVMILCYFNKAEKFDLVAAKFFI